MKILVTGSESYIGAVLMPMLQIAGHEPYGFDKKHLNDICNEDQLIIAMRDMDAIIHLAAVSTPADCEANPNLAHEVNVEAIKMINVLRSKRPIFYPNTNIGYGAKKKQSVYDEKSPMNPQSVYGKTKCEGEQLILDAGDCVVLRLASLFGYSSSMRWNLLLNFYVKEALEKGRLDIYEGHVKRNFLHVKDICRAFIHAIDNYDTMKNEIYNVGLDIHPTKTELALYIKGKILDLVIDEVVGSDPDQRDYVISNEKIKSTGWKPEFTINDGIEELIGVLRG